MATGTVKYDIYSDPKCSELVKEVDAVTVAGEFAPSSSEVTLPAGIYYWQAAYSGDGIDQGSTSACGTEITVVTPAVTTSLSGEGQSGEGIEVVEETAVNDTATLHGEHASSATGTVKYDIYSDPECKDLVAEAGTVSVAGETAPASSEERLTPGMYYWQASYSGDAEMPAAESECETEVALVQTATSLTSSLSGESKSGSEIEVGEAADVSDTATLSGTNASTATGYVEYDVYSDSECKELVAEAGDVSVTSGVVPASEEETLPPGTYYWQASYSGDEANHSSTSTCGSEISIVTAPVTTSLSGEGQTGSEVEVEEEAAVQDTAALHGEHASKATGTVKYDVYSDPECKDLVAEAGEVTVTSGSVPASNEEKLSAGSYYWQASYSGDAENPAAKSACGTEIAVVKPPEGQYAALGDSFSAGVGAGAFYAKTNLFGEEENKCHRSAKAYPARIAEALYPRSPVTEEKEVLKQRPKFIFRACDGAVTENIGGFDWGSGQYDEWIEGTPGEWLPTPEQSSWIALPGGVPSGNPNNKITLVTLTIGGNDAGFATIGVNCATSNNTAVNEALGGLRDRAPYSRARCKAVIEEWETGVAKAPNTLKPPRAEGIPSITTKLPVVLQTIHELAPNARIRIPLYPQLLNTRANGNITIGSGEINFGSPLGHATFFIHNKPPKAADVAVALERFTAKLNRTIAATVKKWAQTEKVNAKVIPSTITAFNGHRLGNRGAEAWVNGLILDRGFLGITNYNVNSMHPTCRGYIAMAERILRSLGRAVPGGWGC
jgi:lysophospholipase L1-like esterase